MNKNVEKFMWFMKSNNVEIEIIFMDKNTHTAKQAAEKLDCDISKICKSLVFEEKETGKPVLILTSGKNRVNINKFQQENNINISNVDADYVKEKSGYSIGGVPPAGFKIEPIVFIDDDLVNNDIIWAAAGMPNTLFSITPEKLITINDAKIINVK